MQDHLSRPTYIQERIAQLHEKTKYPLKVLLVLCDLKNNAAAADTISWFNKTALTSNVTLIFCWKCVCLICGKSKLFLPFFFFFGSSHTEAAHYLEGYVSLAGKGADSIKERSKTDYYSQVRKRLEISLKRLD